MSDLLAIGASGLRAYRTSLAATGDNIANAQTAGYARRGVRLEEVAISGSHDFRYRGEARFDGVDVAATVRAADQWRTSDARLAASADGRAQSLSGWMSVAETALSDSDSGTGAALANLFAAGDRLAADPAGRAPRSAFLSAIDQAASSIRTNAGELSNAATGISDAATSATATFNASLQALADVNVAIRRTATATTAHAELSDQRDRLIDGIAAQSDVAVAIAADGSATITRGTQPLVTVGQAMTLTCAIAADGRISFDIGGTVFQPSGGALGGLQVASITVADRRAALDSLANDLTTALNQWHAGGRTPNNNAGAPLLDASGGATALAALVGDPAQVAAADGTTNGNMLALAGVRTASGVENQWAALVGAQAQATAAARLAAERSSARKDTADAARDQVEGIDLDREAADLLRFQQAYEASARVIQIAKDTIDTILRLF